MKRTIVAGILILVVFGLAVVAALKVQRTSILTLAGMLLTASTVVVADLVTTGFRRRARQTPPPTMEKLGEPGGLGDQAAPPIPPTPPTTEQPGKPGGELWSIPPLEELEGEWVTPIPEPGGAESPPTPPTEIIGRVIGPYQVLERIGQGGMATVYRGFHAELDRYVAIKVLAGALPTTPELIRRFQREAQTIAALRHPNIVQVYDFGPLDDTHYLAMEYVEGSDLQAEMRRRREEERPFSQAEILHLLSQVAEALDYAHSQGVIHRDVKPGNVLLTADGQPILTDFGLATLRRTRATIITTIGQNVLGTPEYTAPEQAMDAQAANPQSDIYSLGCILYELVTGHLPFEGDSALSIALMVISSDPMPPRAHVPDLPAAVERVILCALDKEPQRRFATARAMVEALRRAWAPSPTPTERGQVGTPGDSCAHSAPPAPTASTFEEPGEPGGELSPGEARLVLWAVEEGGGRLSRADVRRRLGLSDWKARQLVERWIETGWLDNPAGRGQSPAITTGLKDMAGQCLEDERKST